VRLSSRVGLGVLVACASAACGRTEANWWSDIYASDTGDEITTSDSGSESSGSESAESESSESESSESESSETDSTDSTTATESTDSSTTEACQPSTVDLTISDSPTVVFLLEQASHMNDAFAGLSRWEAAGTALFDPGQGVAPIYEDEMRLGFTSFTSINGNQGGGCPVLLEVAPALANTAAMEAAWVGAQPEDENPVGDAVAAVSAGLAMDPSSGSKTIVLLTARNPDTCAQPNPQNGADEAEAAVEAAFQAGVGTRIIALGGIAAPYAQTLANVGAGLPAQGIDSAPWGSPSDLDELIADLDAVLASLRPCSFTLAQPLVPEGEQACTLALDGQPLALDDPDGWSVDAGTTLTLLGGACSSFQQLGSLPELTCECEAFP
jgi:hypothetical protein